MLALSPFASTALGDDGAVISGTASGDITLTGSTSGVTLISGTASGDITLTGSSIARQPSPSTVARLGEDTQRTVMLFSGAGTDVLLYVGGERQSN